MSRGIPLASYEIDSEPIISSLVVDKKSNETYLVVPGNGNGFDSVVASLDKNKEVKIFSLGNYEKSIIDCEKVCGNDVIDVNMSHDYANALILGSTNHRGCLNGSIDNYARYLIEYHRKPTASEMAAWST